MRLFLFVCSLVLSSLCKVEAQQNLFNVPSSDITPKDKIFFQQQVNDFTNGFQLNSTFSYGLGSDFECGVNILGLTYDFNDGFLYSDSIVPYSPLICINAQKKIKINERLSFAAGTQIGFHNEHTLTSYIFLNTVYQFHNTHSKLISGIYYSSDGFFGSESRSFFEHGIAKNIGIQCGIEQQIIKDKLLFQADLITGKHTMGENVTGFAYFITPLWILSAGYQTPLFNSTSQKAIVLELTYSPEQ